MFVSVLKAIRANSNGIQESLFTVIGCAAGIALGSGAAVETALMSFLRHSPGVSIFDSETGFTLIRILIFGIALSKLNRGCSG
jgi:hypothetical protein